MTMPQNGGRGQSDCVEQVFLLHNECSSSYGINSAYSYTVFLNILKISTWQSDEDIFCSYSTPKDIHRHDLKQKCSIVNMLAVIVVGLD